VVLINIYTLIGNNTDYFCSTLKMPPKRSKTKKGKKKKVLVNELGEQIGDKLLNKLNLSGLQDMSMEYSEGGGNDSAYLNVSQETPRLQSSEEGEGEAPVTSRSEHVFLKSPTAGKEVEPIHEEPHEEEKHEESKAPEQEAIEAPTIVIKDVQSPIQEEEEEKKDGFEGSKLVAPETPVQTPSNPTSMRATVDENQDPEQDLEQNKEEEEKAKALEQERARISQILEMLSTQCLELNTTTLNILKGENALAYDNIDSHAKEVEQLKERVGQLKIAEDLIQPEFKAPLADLDDECSLIRSQREDCLKRIDERLT
jgi:hypothetical protein